jgi:hypothetical protein
MTKAILPTADQWVNNITLLCMRKSNKFEPKKPVQDELLNEYILMKEREINKINRLQNLSRRLKNNGKEDSKKQQKDNEN